jgi:glycosyltransferase involved in cell wall biosynthesis
MAGRKVVITHHGDLILPRPGGFKSLLNRFIEWGMFQSYRYAAQRAGRIIGYSHDYADNSYYLMPFREKVSIIYPPVPMPEPQPERVAELRAAWQHNGGPIIGYGGRFVEEKRPDLLIRALDVINRQHPDARIVFAGEYDIAYEDFWERSQPIVQKYKDQLIFLGLLTNMQEMANFYAACDVLVLPSATECLGMVQVESMLCGTPAIVSDIPGAREAVRVTGMGRLIMPPGDWRAIGGAVNEMLANPEAYIKAREEIERCYNFKETVDRYERILRANAVKMGRD